MWSTYSVTDRPPMTGTASNCNSSLLASNSRDIIDSSPFLGLVALQLTLLVFISAMGTFANALVFAVFYRRPSLRTISNRSVFPTRRSCPFSLYNSVQNNRALLPDHYGPTSYHPELRGLCFISPS